MKHAATHQPINNGKPAAGNFFVAFGLLANDPGYRQVVKAAMAIGNVAHFNEGLLYLTTECSIDEAFKKINRSIIDPKIASDASLVLVDPKQGNAKWYLNRGMSEMLHNTWHDKTNLFICCAESPKIAQDIQALGTSSPISESIWYVSSTYSPKEAYQILSGSLESNSRLTVFDSAGSARSWQTEWSLVEVRDNLPAHATIHRPRQSMLAESL